MSVTYGPFSTNTSHGDPLLGVHAIHWVLATETYSTTRRTEIEGWSLVGETEDTCMYHQGDRAIIAFRGSQTIADVRSDIQLSRPGGNGCDFTKLGPAMKMVEDFVEENPDIEIQLTGHSLGGAIARCAGQKLGLGIVTFNGASPPSNPVATGPNEVDYHIVFDIISAWQSPNTVRIDKGFRPHTYGSWDPRGWLDASVGPVFKAHLIDNFSNKRQGVVVNGLRENTIINQWFSTLPYLFKQVFLHFIETNRLPPIPS